MPSMASGHLISSALEITVLIVVTKPAPDPPRIPNNPFICEAPIIKAVADVKPTVTGSDMRSTKAPVVNKTNKINQMVI